MSNSNLKVASKFIKHVECAKCGSSDANSLYDDGHQYCFGCNTYINGSDDEPVVYKQQQVKVFQMKTTGEAKAIVDRGISRDTCAYFGVTQDVYSGLHYYPYFDETGAKVAEKIRNVANKTFSISGNFNKATLFGQNLFQKAGKYITIVEGELDALASYQLTGSKWPTVSIRNGASAAVKDCKAQYEYLDSFETIVICFDADEVGQKAAKDVAELFGNKVKIVKHLKECKDACDYLMAGKAEAYVNAWWRAEAYKPEGIVTVSDIMEQLLAPPQEGVAWAFPSLTKLTYGRRKGELYAFGAGVGVGKTDVFTQQIAYDLDVLKKKVGVIYLEQPVVETVQRVAGKLDSRLYHIPNGVWTRDEYVSSLDRLAAREQLFMMDHFGAKDWKTVKSIMKYFAKVYDVEHIYLDHLTALIANEEDERRALDGIMADMASLAQSDGLIIHFISHLTAPDGKPHEEGGRVMEKRFTGSRAIARWSHFMFGLERNKQDEDERKRQTTTFRVLKDRFTGRATAEKIGLWYERNTGLLSECDLNAVEEL